MFRFWNSESRTTKEISSTTQTSPQATETNTWILKRPRQDDTEEVESSPCAKRTRHEVVGPSGLAPNSERCAPRSWENRDNIQVMRDHIEQILGTEILTKHNEKRLIDLELAKCQVALEQLRRCHLVPFPVSTARPDQRAQITNGIGPAIRHKSSERVAQWAPPFGVVDGPYSRHYAKWLLPHAAFDGSHADAQYAMESPGAMVSFPEGRSTRNSVGDATGTARGRLARGVNPDLQGTLNSRNEPKKKPGPCVIKRSDGQWVKLVCVNCNREDFSSTQGFINHCRIAHKNEFKSHEEAAVKCGQPIDAVETRGNASGDDVPSQSPQSAAVHPFARQDMTEQEAYVALRSRIAASMDLFRRGELPGFKHPSRPSRIQPKISTTSVTQASSEAPYLSRLLQARNFGGELDDLLKDVTTALPIDDVTQSEESDDETPISDAPIPRLPVVKRVPARSAQSPLPSSRPVSHKGFGGIDISLCEVQDAVQTPDEDGTDEPSLSPNTLISNNAPSLVSDDGEYDSDEGSSASIASDDSLDDESVSDVAEINLEDEHEPRDLRRVSTGISSAVRLRRDDPKHVPLVNPVANGPRERRRRAV